MSIIEETPTFDRDKPFNRLQKDADGQSKQEHPIEESAKQICPLPAKRELLRRLGPLRYLFFKREQRSTIITLTIVPQKCDSCVAACTGAGT